MFMYKHKHTDVGMIRVSLLTLEKKSHKEHQHINVISIQLNVVAIFTTDAIQLMHPGFHKKTLAMCVQRASGDKSWRGGDGV